MIADTRSGVRLVVTDVDGALVTLDKNLTPQPRAAVRHIIEAGIAFTDWRLRTRHAPHVDREEWTVKFSPTVVSTFEDVFARVVKIAGVSDDLEAITRRVIEVQLMCGHDVSAALSQPHYLDVRHPQANNGEVIAALSALLAIPVAQIATIGDMPSDVLMFERSGVSIATANASAEVQRAARYVTTSNTEEGFALTLVDDAAPHHIRMICES